MGWNIPETFPLFLRRNKDTLEHLAITFEPSQDSSDEEYVYNDDDEEDRFTDPGQKIGRAIAKLKNLTKLHLKCFTPHRPCDLSGLARLAELGIDFHGNIIVKKENIIKLVILECRHWSWGDQMMIMNGIARFENLEELELFYKRYKDFKPLAGLKLNEVYNYECSTFKRSNFGKL